MILLFRNMSEIEDNNVDPADPLDPISDEVQPEMIVPDDTEDNDTSRVIVPDTGDSDTNSRVIIMKSDDVVESVKPEDTESEESSPPEKIIHIQTG